MSDHQIPPQDGPPQDGDDSAEPTFQSTEHEDAGSLLSSKRQPCAIRSCPEAWCLRGGSVLFGGLRPPVYSAAMCSGSGE